MEELAGALAAEEAAIYAYGLIGVHLAKDEQDRARTAEQQHRGVAMGVDQSGRGQAPTRVHHAVGAVHDRPVRRPRSYGRDPSPVEDDVAVGVLGSRVVHGRDRAALDDGGGHRDSVRV